MSPQELELARLHAKRAGFHHRMQELNPHALVTPTIIALNFLVFIAMCVVGTQFWTIDPAVAVRWGSNYGPLTANGQWWRLLTATFIHFGLLHITFNMFALYQTGRLVERMYGSASYLTLYLFAGLTGSFASLLWNPAVNSAGASGAIFGVFGGMLAFMGNKRNAVPPSIMTEHLSSTAIFIVFNLVNGFSHAGIDNAAHIGGLLGGLGAGLLLARPLNLEARGNNGKRIAATLLAAVIVSYGFVYLIAHPSETTRQEIAFQHAVNDFAEEEKPLLTETQDLVKQFQAGSLSPDAFASEIEQQVLPKWEGFYRTFESAKVSPDSKQYPLWETISHYVDARRTSVRLLADGIRKQDRKTIERAKAATAEANAQIAILRKLQQR
jgi:rhomboid protease GluP